MMNDTFIEALVKELEKYFLTAVEFEAVIRAIHDEAASQRLMLGRLSERQDQVEKQDNA